MDTGIANRDFSKRSSMRELLSNLGMLLRIPLLWSLIGMIFSVLFRLSVLKGQSDRCNLSRTTRLKIGDLHQLFCCYSGLPAEI